jgi:YVTN family beta-propeller protein
MSTVHLANLQLSSERRLHRWITQSGNVMRYLRLATSSCLLILGALLGIGVADAAPFAYISNFGGSTVSVIDIATNTVVATVPVGAAPAGVAVNPAGAFVYVANQNSNNVSVIDTGTNTVVATVPVGAAPTGVAVNRAGTFAYVANLLSNNVSVIDTTSDTVVATVPVGASPVGVAVNRAGTFAYVTGSLSSDVSVINTSTNTVVATVVVGHAPYGIAVNPAGTFAYVASGNDHSVSVIDTAINAVVATVPMVGNPIGIAVNAAGTFAYVTVQGSDTISAINTATNTLVTTLPVGSNVFGIALNIAGTFAYVASRAPSNSVSVFNTETNAVVTTVLVGTDPVAFGEFIAGPPATVPGAPTGAAATAGNAQATVTFTAPTWNGDSAITGYTVASNPAGGVDNNAGTTGLSHLVTGLTNGTPYTFTVTATNAIGTGAPSAPSNSVTPTTTGALAPTITSANSALFTQVTFGTFTVTTTGTPVAAITYTGALPTGVTLVDHGNGTAALSGTPTVAGSYPFTITASNGVAPNAMQAFMLTVSAAGPGVPTSVTAISGSGQNTRVGTAFAQPLVALVKDSLGSPVPNVTVTWTTPAAGASATFNGPPSTVTDSSGRATIGATANAIFGTYTVAAQVGVLSASFNLTNAITIASGTTCSGNAATNADLVEDYYAAILRRPSDAGGKAFWLSEADRLCALGVDPKQTFFLLANAFYNSPEYLAFNRDNNGFVTDLYITFFGRLADAGGQSFWLGQLTAGMTRNNLMASFLFSPEFTATMNGLFPGRMARAETYLAMNLYGGLLRRLADSGGYTYWDGQFRSAQCSTSPGAVTAIINAVSSQFLASGEYVARATSNSQFVDDLYYAMLQRGGDLAGFNFWVGQLNAGVTRDQLRQQFLTSPEMQAQSAAIAAQGCLP